MVFGWAASRIEGAGEPWGSDEGPWCMENGLERGGVDGPREKTLSLLAMGSMQVMTEAWLLLAARAEPGEV